MKPILVTAVATLAAAVAGCGGVSGSHGIAGKSIRYQVEYVGSPQTGLAHRAVLISYATNDGIQEQRNVGLPWTTVVTPAGPKLTASVQAQFYGFGTIICRILADDKLIQQHTSPEEPYPKVECKA